MADALVDILAKKYDEEPRDITMIKNYVREHFQQSVAVTINNDRIIISTRASSLAGALRPHLHELSKKCQTPRRLVIRVG